MKLYSAVINDFGDGMPHDSTAYSLGIFKTKEEALKAIKKDVISNYGLCDDFFYEKDNVEYMKKYYGFIFEKEYFKERKDKARDCDEMKELFLDDLMNFIKLEEIPTGDYCFWYYVFEHEIDI